MTEVRFYHLTSGTLEGALPVMLERTLARGQRAMVQAGSDERVEALVNHLWTYSEASFLPHGSARDGRESEQPVWLTAEAGPAPNDAAVLFLTDGAQSARIADFALCAVLFDGNSDEALTASREHWRRLKEEGHELTYWQQDEDGRWEQKA